MTGAEIAGAAGKVAATQLVRRGLPAAARLAGLPDKADKALDAAIREAVTDAVSALLADKPHDLIDHLVGLLTSDGVAGSAIGDLMVQVRDPELPDDDPAPGPLPALVVRFSAAVDPGFDWETSGLDPAALDLGIGRAMLLRLRTAAVTEVSLAPLVTSLQMGVDYARLSAQIADVAGMRAELSALRESLGRIGPPRVPGGGGMDLPPPVEAALTASVTGANGLRVFLAGGRPGAEVANDLMRVPPVWLAEADGHCWLALARYLRLHGLHADASLALEQAAERGAGARAPLLAGAALDALAAEDRDRAGGLLETARLVDAADALTVAVVAYAADDTAGALAATEEWQDSAELRPLAGIRVWALMTSEPDGTEEALRLLEAAVELRQDDPTLVLALAECRLGAAEVLTDRSRHLRAGAHDAALQARDVLRSWAVPSRHAALVAGTALLLGHDRAGAARLLLAPPDGFATLDEAADPRCRSRAATALVALGRRDEAARLRDSLDQGRLRWEASLVLESSTSEPTARVVELMWLLLETASWDGERRAALMGLAQVGVDPPEGSEGVLGQELTREFRGRAAMARGENDEAVRLLGGVPDSARAAMTLASAYRGVGRSDVAAQVLGDAATRLDEPALLTARALLLGDETEIAYDTFGRPTPGSATAIAAADAATADAVSAAPDGPDVETLLGLRARLAHIAGDWRACVRHARASLELSDPAHPNDASTGTRWKLAISLFHLREEAAAWRALRSPTPLEPLSPEQASVSLALAAACADPRALLLHVGTQLARFADDPAFRRRLLTFVILVLDPILSEADLLDDEGLTPAGAADGDIAATEESLRTWVQETMADPGEHDAWRAVPVPEDPAAAVAQLAGYAEDLAARQRGFADALDGGAPLGIMTGDNYAAAILRVEGGVLRVDATDPAVRDLDGRYALAFAAVPGDLVVDLTALHSAVLDDVWDAALRSTADRLVVADAQVAEAHDARWQFVAAPAGSIGNDFYGGPTMTEADPARHAAVKDRATRLAAATKRCHSVPDPGPLDETPERRPVVGAWSTPVSLARDLGVPLLSDDAGQRLLARHYGVPAFGSADLARALHASGAPDPLPGLAAAWRALAPTDLVATGAEMRTLAAGYSHRPGPASWPWRRATTWRTVADAVDEAVGLLRAVRSGGARETLGQWALDMATGIVDSGSGVGPVVALVLGVDPPGGVADPRSNGLLLAGAYGACEPAGLGDDLLRLVADTTERRTGGTAGPGLLEHFLGLPTRLASRLLDVERTG